MSEAIVAATPSPILSAVRRHSAVGTSTRKLNEVRELCRRATAARQAFVAEYWQPRVIHLVLRAPTVLVEERRRTGWPQRDLSVHQNKIALDGALAIIGRRWRAAIIAARIAVRRDPTIDRDGMRWCSYVLAAPELLQECVLRRVPDVRPIGVEAKQARRLCRRLRRMLLKVRGRMPRLKRPYVDVDTNMYRPVERTADRHLHGAWLAVTLLRKGRRTMIPLAGRELSEFAPRTADPNSRPGMRIEVVDDRIVFNLVQRIRRPAPRGGRPVGIDKGVRALLTVSNGDPDRTEAYGTDTWSLLATTVDDLARLRNRRRLAAYERSLRDSDAARATRTRRHSLGRWKADARSRRGRQRLREHVDRTLDRLFQARPDIGLIYVEDLTFTATSLSRGLNRCLGRWLKGYLQRRIAYKAELNGVELKVVPAAYTSQTCPVCSFTSPSNRSGPRFMCSECGYTGGADAVAATNVLRWGSDPAIARAASFHEVRHILQGRWRTARSGRARGSNGAGTVGDVPAGDTRRRSSDQPLERGAQGSIHTHLLCPL